MVAWGQPALKAKPRPFPRLLGVRFWPSNFRSNVIRNPRPVSATAPGQQPRTRDNVLSGQPCRQAGREAEACGRAPQSPHRVREPPGDVSTRRFLTTSDSEASTRGE